MIGRWLPFAALVLFGAGWGLAQPLTKIAVTEGHRGFGVVFWWQAIGLLCVAFVCWLRGRGLVLTPAAIRLYLLLAATAALVPGYSTVTAAQVLPSGIMSLVLSAVPLFAFPIALALGREQVEPLRLAGLALGLSAIALVVLPQSSLPERAMVTMLPIALIAPLCYAIEANVVGGYAEIGLDPVQALYGALAIGTIVSLPLAIAQDSFVVPAITPGQGAIVLSAIVNTAVYAGYVWLVGRAGAVFASQVAYLVTGFGVVWAMLLLGERYSLWVWVAFALLMGGITLVQPRARVKSAII